MAKAGIGINLASAWLSVACRSHPFKVAKLFGAPRR